MIADGKFESSSAAIGVEPEGLGRTGLVAVSGCTLARINCDVVFLQHDGATVEDVALSDLAITTRCRHPMWWSAGEAVSLPYSPRISGGSQKLVLSVLSRFLTCRSERDLFVWGWLGSRTGGIAFSGVDLSVERVTSRLANTCDVRLTGLTASICQVRTAAILARNVADLFLRDDALRWDWATPTYFGLTLDARHVTNLTLQRFEDSAAIPRTRDRDRRHPGDPGVRAGPTWSAGVNAAAENIFQKEIC